MRTSGLWRVGTAGALLLLSGAIAARSGTLAAASEPDPVRVTRLISALNACIQERFKEVDQRFGISRVLRLDATPHLFRPEQAAELDAVAALEQANLRVVLYLASLRVRVPKPDTSGWSPANAWRLIKGPVGVTPALAPRQPESDDPHPPQSLDLWDDSRRALQAFATTDSHEFQSGKWQFIARPIRASEPICLTCHGRASLGDPLGVVLYGYQPR